MVSCKIRSDQPLQSCFHSHTAYHLGKATDLWFISYALIRCDCGALFRFCAVRFVEHNSICWPICMQIICNIPHLLMQTMSLTANCNRECVWSECRMYEDIALMMFYRSIARIPKYQEWACLIYLWKYSVFHSWINRWSEGIMPHLMDIRTRLRLA